MMLKTADHVKSRLENEQCRMVGRPTREGASFASFHCRAQAGESLSVVFFGGSITWGAGASDPQSTSYRALIGKRLSHTYPNARFSFHDAAIGGTSSQLGAFRLERDVFNYQPDLVFVDFALNDGMETLHEGNLASYEAILRRTILEQHAPVVLPLFPYWDIVIPGSEIKLPAVEARIALAKAYHAPVADAVTYVRQQIKNEIVRIEDVWPNPEDHTHPGDQGYQLYAEAAWNAFENAVCQDVICAAPTSMLYDNSYMCTQRCLLRDLPQLPTGWRLEAPSDTSPVNDMKMSRWLDCVLVADSSAVPQAVPEPLCFQGNSRTALLFGESTTKSGRYEITVDGKPLHIVDASEIARIIKGNAHHFHVISETMETGKVHEIVIRPILEPGQELRLESVCFGGATPCTVAFDGMKISKAVPI